MISKHLLQQAADQNIIQNNQIEPLIRFLEERESSPAIENREEPLKFIRSFGDVFITLGIVILAIAINLSGFSGYYYLIPVGVLFLLAEWLVHVRRLALPGIAILISILFFVNKAIEFDHQNATIFGIAILCLTCLLFYLRYKMPFSLFPLAVGLVAISIDQIGLDVITQPIIFVGFGLVVFIFAMWFDVRDTARQSHLSDNAFWLHLLASPMIVHGAMMSMLFSDQGWIQALEKEIVIVIFFCAFLLLALLLDRRAMLISTQVYMVYALTQLFQGQLNSTQNILIYVLMTIGLAVIFFGAFWYKTRRLIFGFLSTTIICRYIPDLNIVDRKP